MSSDRTTPVQTTIMIPMREDVIMPVTRAAAVVPTPEAPARDDTGPNFAAVRPHRARVGDEIASLVMREIAAGSPGVGSFLPTEAAMAKLYSVSRSAVREGLRTLAGANVVEILHGKGTLVRPETDWDVLSPLVLRTLEETQSGDRLRLDLYEVRRILECAAAEMAARAASRDQRLALVAKTDQLMVESQSPETSGREFLTTDREFHDLLAQITGNLALRQIVRQVHSYVASSWTDVVLSPKERVNVARQHKKISDAIAAGDTAGASEAMRAHIDYAEKEQPRRLS
jgi:GntR family galactonate operon transcriptional repressor